LGIMYKNWCANSIAHENKRKLGQKPTYPKGQRRVSHDLAAYLTNTSGISFNDYDFLCTPCFKSAQDGFNLTNGIVSVTPMDTDESLPERAASKVAASNISRISNALMQFPNEESSSSENSDEEVIRLESHLNRERSMAFLNNVFALIREKVNHVVRLIRQAAEQLCLARQKEDSSNDNKPDITIDDSTEIVNNFKYLINASDYSETIKLLTLAPKNWGRLKITNFFGCYKHQAR
ncbi:unnamed protein product, partial [Rotaria sp. Silwood2]